MEPETLTESAANKEAEVPAHDMERPQGMHHPLACDELRTHPDPDIRRVLVTGATGYIGGRLVPELIARGYEVSVMVRSESKEHRERFPRCRVIVAEATDQESLFKALEGIDATYFLLHSLRLGHRRFEQVDLKIAEYFRKAAEACGVRRIIYLSGLGNQRAKLSPHLDNRMKVALELAKGPVPVTTLRAGMIIGSGSASYEILRNLVKNTPVFFIPKWARSKGQPISIRDVLKYLVGVLEIQETAGRTLEIGGKDTISYVDMLKELSKLLGLKRYFLPSLIRSTRVFGHVASWLTPVPGPITKVLVEGCKNEVVIRNFEMRSYLSFEPLSFKEALINAMTVEEKDAVATRWSDAWPPDHELDTHLHELNYSPRYTSSYLLLTHKPADTIFRSFCSVGGQQGWIHNNWMWRTRGAMDKLMQGVGTSRGRRSSSTLRVNDVIDFWRVENIISDHQLLLRAEMKLPGKAWLEFHIDQGEGINRLSVSAYFDPAGWRGHVYWYMFLPFHGVLFTKLLRDIEKRA